MEVLKHSRRTVGIKKTRFHTLTWIYFINLSLTSLNNVEGLIKNF